MEDDYMVNKLMIFFNMMIFLEIIQYEYDMKSC